MKQCLLEEGFRGDSPQPSAAWKAFKKFSSTPVPRDATNCLCEIGEYESEGTNILYFHLARHFRVMSRGEFSHIMDLRIFLKAQCGAKLDGNYLAVWSSQHESLQEYFAAVEASPIFQRVELLPHWEVEICYERV